jgi:hypothetical protein
MVVESQIEPITVVPQDNMPGSEILNVNDEVPHSRLYDDVVSIKTINPDQMLNKKYRVSISVQLKDTTWSLIDVTNNKVLLTNKKEIHGETSSPIIDGFIPVVRANPEGARRDHQTPRGWEYIPTENRYFNGTAANYIMNGFNKGLTYLDSNTLFGRNSGHHYSKLKRVEIRFDKSKTQKVYRYVSMIRSFPFDSLRHPSFEPYVFRRGPGFVYQDFVEVPFTVWEVDPNDGDATPKQINAGFVETNDYLYDKSGKYVGKGNINGKWDPTPASEGGTELLHIFASTYSDSAIPPYTIRNLKWDSHLLDIQYVLWVRVDSFLRKDRKKTFDDGDKFIIQPNYPLIDGEVFEFETKAPIIGDMNRAKEQNALNKINVFPNPYLGGHREEQSLNDRFVIFNHLPSDCIIRIFTLAGTHVRTIHHQSTTSIFERWDLRNENGIFVASAVYIAYIEVPGLGTKVLKLAILMPEERRRTY